MVSNSKDIKKCACPKTLGHFSIPTKEKKRETSFKICSSILVKSNQLVYTSRLNES